MTIDLDALGALANDALASDLKCDIPARTLPPCDLEWGHDGPLHANKGDGFGAREYEAEHRLRQNVRKQVATVPGVIAELRQARDTIAKLTAEKKLLEGALNNEHCRRSTHEATRVEAESLGITVDHVAWVVRRLRDWYVDGDGISFGRMVEKFGFGRGARSVLYAAGGQELSNALNERGQTERLWRALHGALDTLTNPCTTVDCGRPSTWYTTGGHHCDTHVDAARTSGEGVFHEVAHVEMIRMLIAATHGPSQ